MRGCTSAAAANSTREQGLPTRGAPALLLLVTGSRGPCQMAIIILSGNAAKKLGHMVTTSHYYRTQRLQVERRGEQRVKARAGARACRRQHLSRRMKKRCDESKSSS